MTHPLAGETTLIALPIIVRVRDDGGLDIDIDMTEASVAVAEESNNAALVDHIEKQVDGIEFITEHLPTIGLPDEWHDVRSVDLYKRLLYRRYGNPGNRYTPEHWYGTIAPHGREPDPVKGQWRAKTWPGRDQLGHFDTQTEAEKAVEDHAATRKAVGE